MKQVLSLAIALLSLSLQGQHRVFTKDDTLRGSLTPQRTWWDLTYYQLNVSVKPEQKFLSGNVAIFYKVIDPKQEMQIDLQPPLAIEKITQDGEALVFKKKGTNAYFVTLKKIQKPGSNESVTVQYSGNPVEAKRPPWQGGFQWTVDKDGNPFAATSCQGLGASVWWPCKDHMYDEPDSMLISVTVPKNVMDVSNGRLRSATENTDGTKTFNWFVRNSINNYGVNVNIANYTHFADTLHGLKGILDLNYYVLPENLEKAKEQFKQAKLMLKAFEYWFGPYPFYEDGYKLVEVPYLGMEHQSSVTYGNKYQNGYLGRDLSKTGWGLKWDFIIVHESGHEWFANNITYKDIADMWIHESFTNYSESLFTEYYYGKEAATEYVVGTRIGIYNDRPIIGVYNVNAGGSGDMYPKGGNMLHTIRHSINDDKLFREVLLGLNKTFYHQTVTTQQIEDYISSKAKINFSKVFDQYLRTTQIPSFEYYLDNDKLFYRWVNCVKGFNLSLILADGKTRIKPTEKWQSTKLKDVKQFDPANVEKMYYVKPAAVDKNSTAVAPTK